MVVKNIIQEFCPFCKAPSRKELSGPMNQRPFFKEYLCGSTYFIPLHKEDLYRSWACKELFRLQKRSESLDYIIKQLKDVLTSTELSSRREN